MKTLRIIVVIFVSFFSGLVFSQSQNHPVPGTKYAYVFNNENGEFFGWEGTDGTFITPEGNFYDSVTYQGTDIFKSLFIYDVLTEVETYKVLGFTLGGVTYPYDGSTLPTYQLSQVIDYESLYPEVTYNPYAEDYPLPSQDKDENGQFTQRIFVHIFPGDPYKSQADIDSYVNSNAVIGYVSGNITYIGAGVCSEYLSFLNFMNKCSVGRAEVVTDKGEHVAKDGLEILSVYVYSYTSTSKIEDSECLLLSQLSISHSSTLLSSQKLNGITNTCYKYSWQLSFDTPRRFFFFGRCVKRIVTFYYRDQYGNYKDHDYLIGAPSSSDVSPVRSILTFHKSKGDYEIWYIDRKYLAAGYSSNNSEGGSSSDSSTPTLPSPPTELSGFRYFSKDDGGKYHLTIDGVLNEFKTKLKDKYNFNFLGINEVQNSGEGNEPIVGDFQSQILASIEEVNNAEPFSVEVEHRFDIVKGNFRTPEIQVADTKLVFDFQNWFDVEILHVIRSIILYALCIEFFFMTLKLFI
jgi:hypothetical protein